MTRDLDPLTALHRQLFEVRRHCEVLACSPMPPDVAAVFARLAAAKGELAVQLAGQLRAPAVATIVSSRRSARLYRRWLAEANGSLPSMNRADVMALVAAEDRLLHCCERWLATGPSPVLRAALKRYLPQVQACHAELRRLQARVTSMQQAHEHSNHPLHAATSGNSLRKWRST